MRAATPLHPVALPTPLFTRHMLGATEAERDRRLQSRIRGVHRYTSGLTETEPEPKPVVLRAAA
jgi:hypothetical protein